MKILHFEVNQGRAVLCLRVVGLLLQDRVVPQVAIKQALNVDAAVMWRIENGTSGKHFDVYVKFGQAPHGSMAEIRATVERIVNSTFRDKVTRVSMSM
jgi:hypothetical protein